MYSKIRIARVQGEKQETIYSEYTIKYDPNKSVLQLLRDIYALEDKSLSFRRYCCNRGVCGSCSMIINGKVKRACVTLMTERMTIEPIEKDGIIKDLVSAHKDD